jgi:hypothetical protein
MPYIGFYYEKKKFHGVLSIFMIFLSGNNIQFSPALRIPIEHEMPVTLQQDSHEIMIQRFKNITQEDFNEAKYYLEGSEYNLEKSVATWKEDKDWNDTHFHTNSLSSDLPDDQERDPSNVRPSRRGCLLCMLIMYLYKFVL